MPCLTSSHVRVPDFSDTYGQKKQKLYSKTALRPKLNKNNWTEASRKQFPSVFSSSVWYLRGYLPTVQHIIKDASNVDFPTLLEKKTH